MSLRKKSKLLVVVALALVIGGIVVYKATYKPHKTVADLKLGFSGTAMDFVDTFKTENSILQNASVQLTGLVTSSDNISVTLNTSVYCLLDANTNQVKVVEGQQVTVKARYIGYDDLLEQIKLDQTIILK